MQTENPTEEPTNGNIRIRNRNDNNGPLVDLPNLNSVRGYQRQSHTMKGYKRKETTRDYHNYKKLFTRDYI